MSGSGVIFHFATACHLCLWRQPFELHGINFDVERVRFQFHGRSQMHWSSYRLPLEDGGCGFKAGMKVDHMSVSGCYIK